MEFADGGTIGEGEFLESAEAGVALVGAGTDDGNVVARFEDCGGRGHRFNDAGEGSTED